MENNSMKKLSCTALKSMYGCGYTDICDEWVSIPGKYYSYLNNWVYQIKHNYEVKIDKVSKDNWHLLIYLCLTACNSDDVKIVREYKATLKECKAAAVDFINAYDDSEKAAQDIEEWKNKHAKAVFKIEDGQLKLLGTSYRGLASHDEPGRFDYYNEDRVKCGIGEYYLLDKWRGVDPYISKYEMRGGCTLSYGVENAEMLATMKKMIAHVERFARLVS